REGGGVRGFALSVSPVTPSPHPSPQTGRGSAPRQGHLQRTRLGPALVMVVMMVVAVTAMIMRVAVPMSIVMIMMMNTLMRAAAARVFAEQQRLDRHRHGE